MQLLKNKPIRDMKKLFFYCIIAFFITSCASYKYSKKTENTFNLTSNVDQVIVSNKSGSLRSINKSSSYQNHNYEINLDKINNKYLSLQVTKNNYDTVYLKLKKTPRFGAIARDFFIGIPTFFTPFLIDAFRSDFYQISSKSKHQEVKLKYHQEFMKNEFKKIENSASPSDFVDYISNYPHSNFVNQATDKKDASELVIAVNKVSESEIDNYILSHQNSSSLNEAKKIKAEIVEARIAFQEATNLNSVSAYEQFLAKYPKSIPHKEAHIKLIDAAEKVALSSNNLKQMLAYYDNYLQNFKNFIGEETYKSKNAIISKTIDNQIVLENNPKQLWNYNEYSKLWITYIDVSTKYKNKLLTLDISKAYDLKISSELFALLIKISDANKHAEFLQKASIDFPELSNTKDLILITILQKSSNKNGNLKLFNQAYVSYLISKNKLGEIKSVTGEGGLYDLTSFNYKNNKYQSIEGSTFEELTFKNNEIQEIKVFKDNNLQTQLKFSSGYSNLNEASYFINGKLVLTDFMQFASKLYSYEFEDGVNLSLKQLENKIKEGDAALASKNFDMALEIYSKCSNDYPPTIELNKRIENSINNAENKKNSYLQKIEKERMAEEKKQEQKRIVEEKKQEAEEAQKRKPIVLKDYYDLWDNPSKYSGRNVGMIMTHANWLDKNVIFQKEHFTHTSGQSAAYKFFKGSIFEQPKEFETKTEVYSSYKHFTEVTTGKTISINIPDEFFDNKLIPHDAGLSLYLLIINVHPENKTSCICRDCFSGYTGYKLIDIKRYKQ